MTAWLTLRLAKGVGMPRVEMERSEITGGSPPQIPQVPDKEEQALMTGKSDRRQKLEESLAADPGDTFLRYGLAVQCLREGDSEEGRERLKSLIADHPEDQIAAYQQLGQSFAETGETETAIATLKEGVALARARNEGHAAAEMQQLLDSLL
jgi:thioredoxin-like negative regulator of GroEL